MEFGILGPLEVRAEGRLLRLAGPKQRALLAVLLLHANEPVSADRLSQALWGEDAPAGAAKTVQVHIWRLRKALADDGGALATTAAGYRLRVDPGQLDLQRFEQLLAEGRRALASGAHERAAARIREALEVWRGPPLAELAFEPFAQTEITRLDELRLAAIEERVEAELALGRHDELIGELERLVAEHPVRERLHGQLMLALYRAGRQAEALARFQGTRRTLVEKLAIEPSRALRELERAILLQDPALDALPRTQRPRTRTVGAGVFVGRQQELEALSSALDDALAGTGRLVLVAGEPGIGKTRLASALADQAEDRGVQVRWGRCWEAGGAPPYWPFIQPLRSYVRECEPRALRSQLGAGAPEVAQMLPELRELFRDLPDASIDDAGARFRLFDATASFLRNLTQARPLVLVLDDLHAADAPSLLLLRFVARELADTRILIVAAYRDPELSPADPIAAGLTEIARTAHLRLDLGGLVPADIAKFITETAGIQPSQTLVAALAAATEGNPLFVAEIVRLLTAEGRLEDAGRDGRSLGLPRGIREVIGSRLRRLSGECVGVLSLASVLGREFAVDDLTPLSRLERAALLVQLDEAARAGIVSVVPGVVGRLRFSHALVRDTLYDDLPPAQRARLHARAGAALEAFPDTRLAELAHHFVRALPEAPLDKAVDYARRAGEEAMSLFAYEEAARAYEMALAALTLSRGTREETRCRLLIALGGAQIRGGDAASAQESFLEAAAVARRLELSGLLARAALGYGGRFVWARAGADDRLVPLLEEALAALGDEDSELRARLYARLATALRDDPAREPRAELSRRAVEIARRVGDRSTLAYALAGRYAAVWWSDNARERLALADELVALAAAIGDPEREVEGHGYMMHALLELGEVEAAAAELEIRRRLTNEMRQPAQLWIQLTLDAMWSLLRGSYEQAENEISGAFELGTRAQPEEAHTVHQLQLFALRREQAMLQQIEDSLAACARAHPSRPVFACALATLHRELGCEAEARNLYTALSADDFGSLPLDNDWLFEMTLLTEVCEFLDDADSAARLYQHLLPFESSNVIGVAAEVATGATSRYLGILASATGRFEWAERHFGHALALNVRSRARPSVAHTQHDYARMLFKRDKPGDRDHGNELLASCLATCAELGMAALAARASALRPSP